MEQKKQIYSDVTHALSFLENDGVEALAVTYEIAVTTAYSTQPYHWNMYTNLLSCNFVFNKFYLKTFYSKTFLSIPNGDLIPSPRMNLQ